MGYFMLKSLLVEEPIFVIASHRTEFDTRSMTRKSINVGITGGGGRARVEAQAQLDYDATRPPEGGPSEVGGLTVCFCPYHWA